MERLQIIQLKKLINLYHPPFMQELIASGGLINYAIDEMKAK